jgi:hypothetical protein
MNIKYGLLSSINQLFTREYLQYTKVFLDSAHKVRVHKLLTISSRNVEINETQTMHYINFLMLYKYIRSLKYMFELAYHACQDPDATQYNFIAICVLNFIRFFSFYHQQDKNSS